MLKYTAHKLLVALLVAITVSFAAFMLLRLSGDLATAMADETARGEDIQRIRTQLGLDINDIVQGEVAAELGMRLARNGVGVADDNEVEIERGATEDEVAHRAADEIGNCTAGECKRRAAVEQIAMRGRQRGEVLA